MPTFRCRIATRDGGVMEKVMASESVSRIRSELAREGQHLVSAVREGGGRQFFSLSPGFRIKPRRFYAFNQELAVLLKAGLPVVGALDNIIKKTSDKIISKGLTDIRNDIASGTAVSDALAKYPQVFSPLYLASLRSGEAGGDLPGAIDRYLVHRKKTDALRHKVRAAAVYPAILTVCSVVVVTFLLIFVVPAITGAFTQTGTEVPALTRILLAVSGFIRDGYLWLFFSGMGLVVLMIAGMKYEPVRRRVHRFVLGVPVLGDLIAAYAAARFSAVLATLIQGGNPLNRAVRIAVGLLGNLYMKQMVTSAVDRMEQGAGFATSLEAAGVFPDMAVSMIAAGEEGGSLDTVLVEVAGFYDAEVENRLALITTSIEPLLMVVMGGIIGFIVLAMYMPIFQMAGTIG